MRKIFISLFLICLTTIISSCSAGVSGLQSYVNTAQGYEFLYPNGWIPVDVKNASPGVDLVFRDLIERGENLSVVISDVPAIFSLKFSKKYLTIFHYLSEKKLVRVSGADRSIH